MLTTLPRPRGIIRLAASRPITKALVRFASITLRHSSVASSTIGFRNWMPALLTRMSISMPSASNRWKAATTAASSVTSKRASWTVYPAIRISSTAADRRPWSEPLSTTVAPAAASPSAIARPRPRDDPVTRAVQPSSENRLVDIVGSSGCFRTAHGEIGTLEHGRQQFGAEAGAFHRIDVTVLDDRDFGDEFLVPAGIEGADRFLDQRVRLAERGMDGGGEADRSGAVV